MTFDKVFGALKQGESVRRNKWDKGSFMFIQNGILMYSSRGREAHPASGFYGLDWINILANDWNVSPKAA
ncbi:MAG: hypothetical protein FWD64_02200 [Acidobacteriaceae bacterium]|nr:hypothetical protein [Acidobacteriaceae bacterium]